MMFNIRIADVNFTISSIYDDIKIMCSDYLTDQPGVEITITKDDIEKERIYVIREAFYEGRQPEVFSDGALEVTAVYRKIADYFSFNDSAVFHGALISLNGEGYLFTAASGTGKTTHIRNWIKCFPDTRIINGDKPVLRLLDGAVVGYGTPWSGKEGYNENASVPIKAVISLNRGEENKIEKVPFKEIFPVATSAIYKPKDGTGTKRAVEFLIKMSSRTSFYRLTCNMEENSAITAYEGMQG